MSIVLSKCNEHGVGLPKNGGIATERLQQRCWISIGAVPLLRIGDLWTSGVLTSSPDYEIQSFSDLLIDQSSSSLIKAGLELGASGFLLPFDEHPWHMGDTHSKCVLIEMPDDRQIIVPCVELVRFYFGSSSDLVARLFQTSLRQVDLFSRYEKSVSGFRTEIDLADGIPRASASDVARIAGDPIAWRAAQAISISCARASAAGKRIYPSAHFPFHGRTDLVASGQWLGPDRRTFLVYHLRSCSHPFPFRSLSYRLGAGTLEGVRRRSAISKGGSAGASPSSASPAAIQEREASARYSRSEWLIARFARFPDLENKGIRKEGTHISSDPSAGRPGSGNQSVDLALGAGVGSDRVRPLTLSYIEQTIESAPAFLRGLLQALQLLQGVGLTHLTGAGEDGWTVSLPLAQRGPDECSEDRAAMKRVAGFVLLDPAMRLFLLVAAEGSPTTVLLSAVPTDEHGEAIMGAPADLHRLWASFLDDGALSRQSDVDGNCSPEFMCAWIQERMASVNDSALEKTESWHVLAYDQRLASSTEQIQRGTIEAASTLRTS